MRRGIVATVAKTTRKVKPSCAKHKIPKVRASKATLAEASFLTRVERLRLELNALADARPFEDGLRETMHALAIAEEAINFLAGPTLGVEGPTGTLDRIAAMHAALLKVRGNGLPDWAMERDGIIDVARIVDRVMDLISGGRHTPENYVDAFVRNLVQRFPNDLATLTKVPKSEILTLLWKHTDGAAKRGQSLNTSGVCVAIIMLAFDQGDRPFGVDASEDRKTIERRYRQRCSPEKLRTSIVRREPPI